MDNPDQAHPPHIQDSLVFSEVFARVLCDSPANTHLEVVKYLQAFKIYPFYREYI